MISRVLFQSPKSFARSRGSTLSLKRGPKVIARQRPPHIDRRHSAKKVFFIESSHLECEWQQWMIVPHLQKECRHQRVTGPHCRMQGGSTAVGRKLAVDIGVVCYPPNQFLDVAFQRSLHDSLKSMSWTLDKTAQVNHKAMTRSQGTCAGSSVEASNWSTKPCQRYFMLTHFHQQRARH